MPKQFEVEVGWGLIKGQVFGEITEKSKPIIALHGFLDNSNSFKPIAPFLIKENEYYIIAIDLPGMGLSSKIPDGIPYSTKLFVMSLRRVVLHFGLEHFIFLTHSFGCSIAIAYSACYNEQVIGMVFIDFAMKDSNIDPRENIGECWRDGIETYLKAEKIAKEKSKTTTEKLLTYDFALNRLLEANKHIDETSAKILLERGLIYKNDKLEYSRDLRLVTGVSFRDYHLEFHGIYEGLFKNLASPILLIYATPPPYGESLFNKIMSLMDEIKQNSKSTVDLMPFEGTHHFHMINPAGASRIVFDFLKNKLMQTIPNQS